METCLIFSQKKFTLVSFKIYDKKEYHCQKGSKYQNDFMKSISPSGFSIYEYGNLFFSS